MPIKRRKISDLDEAGDLTGFFTIGYRVVDGVRKSVRHGLEYIHSTYLDMLRAISDLRGLEATVVDNEARREEAEGQRDASERDRETAEEARDAGETARETGESGRANAESGRSTAEAARRDAEAGRVSVENARVTQEGAREMAETVRREAEKSRGTAEAGRTDAEAKRVAGESGRAIAEENRATVFATLRDASETATANANDTAAHPTHIGADHYVYGWNKATGAYDKTDIYCKGDAFSVKEVYASVAALLADVGNAGIAVGDFVLVNAGDAEDPDNARLYVKARNASGAYSYDFLVDMSGAIGFTGKTPQLSIGTVSGGTGAAATLSEDGTDAAGNPRYKLGLVLPRGDKGETPFLEAGTVTTGEAGSPASATLVADGSTSTGAPRYRLDMSIPRGARGDGNVQVDVSGLAAGKTYLFRPSADDSADGTLVEFSQAQADWNAEDTGSPSFIKGKPSAMPASDVHGWAKQPDRPTYTATDVGAVSKSGDTMTGALTVPYILANSTDLCTNLNANFLMGYNDYWRSGNVNLAKPHIFHGGVMALDLSGYDSNKWYPCWFYSGAELGNTSFEIVNALSSNVPIWSTHAGGFTLIVKATVRGSGWGAITPMMYLEDHTSSFGGESAFGGIEQNSMASHVIVWLRGGGVYKCMTSAGNPVVSEKDGYHFISASTGSRYDRDPRTTQGDPHSGFTSKRVFAVGDHGLYSTAYGHTFDPRPTKWLSNRIIATETWFYNDSSGAGLYNSAEDARWYASGGRWVSDKPINITGLLNIQPLPGRYAEGIRIGSASNGWSSIQFGVDTSASTESVNGQWLAGKNPANTFMICPAGTEVAEGVASKGLSIGYDGITRLTGLSVHSNSAYNSIYTTGGVLATSNAPSLGWDNWQNHPRPFSAAEVTVSQGAYYPVLGWSSLMPTGFRQYASIGSLRDGTFGRVAITVGNSDNNSTSAKYLFGSNGVFEGATAINTGRVICGYDSGVGGSVNCSDWFRTTGAGCGIYNATHGAGIGINSTWVESHNKPFKSRPANPVGCNGFPVCLSVGDNTMGWAGLEIVASDNAFGIGVHTDDNVYLWGGTSVNDYSPVGKTYYGHIGLANKTFNWYGGMVVSGRVSAAGGFFKESDIRLKSGVKPLSHTLEQILSIPTTSFTMNGKRQVGSIAQEIERVCPEMVTETLKLRSDVPHDDGWEVEAKEEGGERVEYVKVKSVEYEMLAVLAIEGLRLLNDKVEDLKKQSNICQ